MSLRLAIPSKGRLEAQTREWFGKRGISLERPLGDRGYIGAMSGFDDIELRYLSASEIAHELITGQIDLGVTGEDLIHEVDEQGPEKVDFLAALGFGGADVVVAVPRTWLDVQTMRDLADVGADFRKKHGRWLRIATKYFNLTRRFFYKNDIAEYRIVESLGATEGAPASGKADLIVDITTTGSTLEANGLKIISDGVMLKSEANLILSQKSRHSAQKQLKIDRFFKALDL